MTEHAWGQRVADGRIVSHAGERGVILACSAGRVFERYDSCLYTVLASAFASFFFPPGDETAALLPAFAA